VPDDESDFAYQTKIVCVVNLAQNDVPASAIPRKALAGALCLALTLAGCSAGGASTETTRSNTTMSAAERQQLSRPHIVPPSQPPPQRLVVKDLKTGWGLAAAVGDELTVEYVGVDYETGVERWHSRGRLEPSSFHLGAFDVAPGWERGLKGMRVGGRRELIVPSRLASGKRARIYVVDLLEIQRGPIPRAFGASDGPQDPDKPTIKPPGRPPPKGLLVKELRKGSGRTIEEPAEVVVKLLGVDYRNGEAFLNAWGPDQATVLPLQDAHSIWAAGLRGMKVGGRRELVVPSKLAYGNGAQIYVAELTSAK
jgi:peptidylprolyl isomerase